MYETDKAILELCDKFSFDLESTGNKMAVHQLYESGHYSVQYGITSHDTPCIAVYNDDNKLLSLYANNLDLVKRIKFECLAKRLLAGTLTLVSYNAQVFELLNDIYMEEYHV